MKTKEEIKKWKKKVNDFATKFGQIIFIFGLFAISMITLASLLELLK